MLRLPSRFAAVILSFAPLFSRRSWRRAEVLLIGAILVPGKRTVTSLLRIAGLRHERRFVNYHRVLNRAVWSARAAARPLLGMLIEAFVPDGPCWASTTPSSGGGAGASVPRASTATRCAPRMGTS
jgi:hypothetical protein